MDLCAEIAVARESCGLTQNALANMLNVPRMRITRLEAGVGSVELTIRVMQAVGFRVLDVAKGDDLAVQIANARLNRGWSVTDCARRAFLDQRTVEAVEAGGGSVASLAKILVAVAPAARPQSVQRAIWHYDRSRSSEADVRFTPKEFLSKIVDAFGEIALDPCSHAQAPIEARRKIILPEDGLSSNWATEGLVWINPPFSNLAPWMVRANAAWRAKEVSKMIFLLPASRLDLRAYFEEAAFNAITLILGDRLRFASLNNPSGTNRAPFALTLVLWGCAEDEIDAFVDQVPAIRIPMRM